MTKTHGTILLLVVLVCVSPAVVMAQEYGPVRVAPGEILVQYDRDCGRQSFDGLCLRLSELGFGLSRHYPLSALLRVRLPYGADLNGAMAMARQVVGVRRAEPVYICQASGGPNDQWYWLQWNLKTIGYESAWETFLSVGSYGDRAIIAVLDTGVAYEDYADSKYRYERAPDLEGRQFVDGYDAVNDDNHPNDDNGHGTFVCGVIAQTTNNMIGTASIGFGCKIMPVKVLNEYQTGDIASVTEGIYFAVDNGADVINQSFGLAWYYSRSEILEEAVAYAAGNGVVMVGASGNKYLPYVEFPAAYNECLAVGAVTVQKDERGRFMRADYSSYGVALDVVAPGGDFQDRNQDGYPEAVLAQSFDGGQPCGMWDLWWAPGTSAAAAQVSSIAGLLVSLGFDREEVIAVIKGTASKVTMDNGPYDNYAVVSEFDCQTGYGLVSVSKALECALTGVIPKLPQYKTSVNITQHRRDGMYYAQARVTVMEKSSGFPWYSYPAAGVTVYGYWKGSAVGQDSEVTSPGGRCTFTSDTTMEREPHFEFVITNVVRGGQEFSGAAELGPDEIVRGDAMIVRPLRSTGPVSARSFQVYQPWYIDPASAIY